MGIILVGGSDKLLDRRDGEFIDTFDSVVRFNGGNPINHQESIGSKTDYWSFSTLFAAQYQRWKIPNAIPMCLNMRIEYPFVPDNAVQNNAGTYRQLRASYGHPRPSTGLVTAHYISKLWDCEVSCIGFDFFESDTWYTGPPSGVHNGTLERKYMESLGVTIL